MAQLLFDFWSCSCLNQLLRKSVTQPGRTWHCLAETPACTQHLHWGRGWNGWQREHGQGVVQSQLLNFQPASLRASFLTCGLSIIPTSQVWAKAKSDNALIKCLAQRLAQREPSADFCYQFLHNGIVMCLPSRQHRFSLDELSRWIIPASLYLFSRPSDVWAQLSKQMVLKTIHHGHY